MFDSSKLVGAICHAGWVLISAKIVNGLMLTGFSAIKDDLKNAGAKYIDNEVVVDGNVITSRMPSDLPAFMREIIKFLNIQ
jgi:protease I